MLSNCCIRESLLEDFLVLSIFSLVLDTYQVSVSVNLVGFRFFDFLSIVVNICAIVVNKWYGRDWARMLVP